jgi:tetratricopeptide (TPR) repeat protein
MNFRRSEYSESFSIADILRSPFRTLSAIFQFMIYNWSSSRNGAAFLRGTPAVLGLLGIVGPLIVANYVLPSKQYKSYLGRTLFYQESAKDYATAEMMGRKLVRIDPTILDSYWLLGEAIHAQVLDLRAKGETLLATIKEQEVQALMDRAASFGEGSSFRAHIWNANNIFQRITNGEDTPELRDEARRNLQFVADNADEKTRLESIRANLSLASLYLNEKNYTAAEEILQTILKDDFQTIGHVDAALRFAEVLKRTNRLDELKTYCDKTADRLLKLAIKYPDFFEIWRGSVEICLMRDDGRDVRGFERARSVIRTGIELAPNTSVKRNIASLGSYVLIRQARVLEEAKFPADLQQRFLLRLGLLALAIRDNPMERLSYEEILEVARNTELYPEAEKWRTSASALVPGLFEDRKFNIPADYMYVFNILDGTLNALEGKFEATNFDWQQASVQSPIAPAIMNNFALIAMNKWPAEVDKVLGMLNIAEKLFPTNRTLFLRSRAEVYFISGDLNEAQKHYEEFVALEPNIIDAMNKLVLIYNRLDMKAKASELQQKVNLLEAEKLRNNPEAFDQK